MKKSSPQFEIAGERFEYHWYEHPGIGRFELKSLVDPREPRDWITEFGADGERYSYPRALNSVGFFEDFFDQKAKAVATFWRVVNHRLAEASEVA